MSLKPGDRLGPYTVAYFAASAFASLGDHEKALDLLEKSKAGHSFETFFSGVDPALDPLRNEPRFRAFLASIGLVKADESILRR